MKKTLSILAVLAMVLCVGTVAHAYKLTWTVAGTYDGCDVYWRQAGSTTAFTKVDVGKVTSYVIDSLPLVKGTRYEFYVDAYYKGSFSGPSDTLRWTFPADSVVVEYPDAPKSVILQFGQ